MLPDHRAAMEKNRMSAMMCVPVRVESRTLGTLHIMRERGYQFSQDELSLALSLADQAAIAIENARLHQAALEAAGLEAEARGRLEGISLTARELAHLLNNDLAVPVGLVELLQRQRSDLHGLGDMLDEAARGLEAAVERIRRLQQVVRVETKQTPVGPALDLERSSSPY
jgi:GAF domain-containing protein